VIRAFTIDALPREVIAENNHTGRLQVADGTKGRFGNVDLLSDLLDSFRQDYGGGTFTNGSIKKADEPAYVCYEGQDIVAFLYSEGRGPEEPYGTLNQVQIETQLKIAPSR